MLVSFFASIGTNLPEIFNGLIAFFIGCLAALAELLSRYKNFRQICSIRASQIYLLINGIASLLAYIFVVQFNIGQEGILRVILAGTASLVILRSSFANIKVGEKKVEAGIGAILQVFLNAADRSFDQKRSDHELSVIESVMEDVNFEKAKLALPITCFTIMKNVSQEEQDRVSADVKKLSGSNLDNKTKCINLGILLANITGLELLQKSVQVLSNSISNSGAESPEEKLNRIMSQLSKLK
jgi:hypothetical protein